MTCHTCGRFATVHLTGIGNGRQTERHSCRTCAAAAGASGPAVPVDEALTRFAPDQFRPGGTDGPAE